jgi:hypothetical protein
VRKSYSWWTRYFECYWAQVEERKWYGFFWMVKKYFFRLGRALPLHMRKARSIAD